MNIGMMWFDNDPKKTLTTKIMEAADYYHQKYGGVPDICLVNLSMSPGTEMKVGRVTVKPMRSILPGHLWIGVEENVGEGRR
jgi:hypothetical protein